MSLKLKYILFIGLLHGILVVLIYNVLKENKWLFIASELVILFSLYLSYLLYSALIKPIDLMQSGTDAIAEKDFSVKYLKTGSKEVDKLVEVFNTMIDNLRQERVMMAEQSYFLQNLLEVSPLATVILDMDGKLASVNPSAKNMLGIDRDYQNKSLADYESGLITEIAKVETNEPTMITTNGVDRYKCQISEVVHQGFKRRFILIDDLSTEMLESEKAAFGRIIRMMAHEVNNSMGAVNSILDTVVEFGFADDKNTDLKDSLIIAMERNKGLAKFVDNYASILRLPAPHKQSVDLCNLLRKTSQLFYPIAKENDISIGYDLPSTPVMAQIDPVMIEQAITNMIKNALESVVSDGDISISCTASPPSFSITDDGPGITAETEAMLFTPFFSTKPTGQGVGLMLIREILVSHEAEFSLRTDSQSKLTTFSVTF